MPNHCECDLEIQGSRTELKRFMSFARSRYKKGEETAVLDADKFIPYPKKYKDLDKKVERASKRFQKKLKESNYDKMSKAEKKKWDEANPNPTWKMKDGYNAGGYEWCINNWGTKWGIYEAELVESYQREIMYTFRCAWGPCIPVIKAMSKKFPKLNFRLTYFEQGCQFNGIYICEKGEVITDDEGKYFGNRGG